MGNKMKAGGIIDRSKIPGMPSDADNVSASLEEYITIIAAGLSDTTTHTQAATILALSRVVFEFKESLNLQLLQELTGMIELFWKTEIEKLQMQHLDLLKLQLFLCQKTSSNQILRILLFIC